MKSYQGFSAEELLDEYAPLVILDAEGITVKMPYTAIDAPSFRMTWAELDSQRDEMRRRAQRRES
jgi:hypothetical protein